MFKRILFTLAVCACLAGVNGTFEARAEKIIVATDCTFPPMEYLDAEKRPAGIDPTLIKEIAKAAGFEVEVQNIAWDGIFAGVAAGKYDIVASAVSITPERSKAFLFSDPYFYVYPSLLFPADSPLGKPGDLRGRKVGGQIGNSALVALDKLKTGCQICEYDDVALAVEDMLHGRIDAVALDSPVALYYLNKKQEYRNKLKIAMKFGEPEQYGFVLRKGSQELLDRINKALRTVKENGTYDRVINDELGEFK